MKKLLIFLLFLVKHEITFSQDGKVPIIDVHIQSRIKSDRNEKGEVPPRSCFPEPCEKIPAAVKKDEDILRTTPEAMKKYNIVKGVISNYGIENVFA